MGTIVHLYDDGRAYEVEFTTLAGKTAAVVTVEAADIRPVNKREITHARQLQSVRHHDHGRVCFWILAK